MNPTLRAVVDVDDPDTWPAGVCDLVARWDAQLADPEDLSDLDQPEEFEQQLYRLLDGHRLRAYHCTRLLPHETDQVRHHGLRMFDTSLFDDRIDQALTLGYLTDDQHQALRAGQIGVAELDRAKGRWRRVWLSLSRTVLDRVGPVEPLLSRWGGEGIYFSNAGTEHRELLARLGRPAIVVCGLTFSTDNPPRFFPYLAKGFRGTHRGGDALVDVLLRREVTTSEIDAVIGPGDQLYDAHTGLPSS